MWLNPHQRSAAVIKVYKASVLGSCPNHVVIDDLFNAAALDRVMQVLHQQGAWQRQRHTYSALYVDDLAWQGADPKERFVQRDVWQRSTGDGNIADEFLAYLRSADFMAFLSDIFSVALTDLNVSNAELNSNFFRMGSQDFVKQHADDSPGREICMLLYLNKGWAADLGGELTFLGDDAHQQIKIPPAYNRCIVFKPESKGAEHWVEAVTAVGAVPYRYNITSWYWSE